MDSGKSSRTAKYVLAIFLLCVLSIFRLMSEAPMQQLWVGDGASTDLEQLHRLQDAKDEVSWLQNELDKSKEQMEKLQQTQQEVSKLKSQLDESKEQMEKLQKAEEEVLNLKSELEKSKEQMEKLQNEATVPTNSSSALNLSGFDPNNICSIFPPSGSPSPTRLWKENLSAIFEASKNPSMEEFQESEQWDRLRVIIEDVLSPARMRRSIQHLPTFSHTVIKNVMEILQKRIADPKNNPPLQIAVFGGSVTLGRDCVVPRMKHLECAWPHRFENFVNRLFGQQLIAVHNFSIGGTNSKSATNMVKYWMYGPHLSKTGPDVIINSYSTNDSLPPWGKTWPEEDLITIVRDQVRDVLQDFIRAALESKPCSIPPLVVHVDDYLGPQQPALLGELSYVSSMTQIAKYYDTVGISYGEVVRDIVYQNHSEVTFHNQNDVHFGRFAHITIALSVAFASLELLINYCDDEHNGAGLIAAGEEEKKGDPHRAITKEEMRRGKQFLPPPLTKELLYANATNEFDAALNASYSTYVDNDCGTNESNATVGDRNPCLLAWISTPGLYDHNSITRFMKKYQTQNDGWQAERANTEGWSNKDGWIATKANATFTLQFTATKNVKTISIYFLRSWGEKWKDSKAKFTASRLLPDQASDEKVMGELEIDGVHADEDYHYTLTFSETMRLAETIEAGQKINLRVDLVSGSHFKMMGLMICNK